jgi:site-specific recombinase XerC
MFQVADINLVQYRITLQRLKGSYSGILLCGLMKLRVDEIKAPKAYPQECTIESPMLFRSQRGTPISRRQLDTPIIHSSEGAEVPASKRHFHGLKHFMATHLLDAGADRRFVQDWVGHGPYQERRRVCPAHEPS